MAGAGNHETSSSRRWPHEPMFEGRLNAKWTTP